MDPSPASDPAVVALALGIVGTAVTALGFAVKALSKRKTPSVRPQPATSSSSGQMRAVTEEMARREADRRMREELHVVHSIVTARDARNEQYRVHNKADVEDAIVESRRLDQRQVELLERQGELLEQILEAVSESPGRYRKRLPSTRGGE